MRKNIYSVLIFTVVFLTSISVFAQNQNNVPVVKLSSPRKTIAVTRFQNNSGIVSYLTMGDDFAAQLTDALKQSGRFIVLSRQDLGAVLAEQDLVKGGRVAKSLTAQTGKVIPAQILVTGSITEFQENTSGGAQGLSISGVNIGMSKSNAHIAVIIQIIDSTTGEILDSQRIEGLADSSGFGVGYSGSFSIGSSSFQKTPLGKATQIAIDRAVEYISQRAANYRWQGRVVTVKDGLVYINAGSDAGIVPGKTFTVYKKGESLVDPETGIELGSEKTKIADILVSEVEPKFSKAKILSNTGEIKTSDLVFE